MPHERIRAAAGEEIGNLPKYAKEQIYLVIDALIRDYKAKKTYS